MLLVNHFHKFGLAPTRDEPVECLRGPVERGFVVISPARGCKCPERTADGLCHKKWDVCLIFGIPSWLMPLRDRSGQRWPPSGMPYVVAATEVCSKGSLEPVASLVPPPSPSLPFLSLLFGVFLNGRLRIAPFFLWCVPGRLFVAGNTCLFLFSPSLSLPLSLFLSLFPLHLPSSLGVPGCFVIAGNAS